MSKEIDWSKKDIKIIGAIVDISKPCNPVFVKTKRIINDMMLGGQAFAGIDESGKEYIIGTKYFIFVDRV